MDKLPAIFARNCKVVRINKLTASAFLNANHRLGDAGCRYRYALTVERSTGSLELSLPVGTLVAVAEFSNARRWLKDDKIISSYEWIRYASLKGMRVTGGMSRLLQAFIDDVHPDDIMSYSDLGYPDGGKAYVKLGFVEEELIERPGFSNIKYRLKLTDW